MARNQTSERGVESILHLIIRSPRHRSRNHRPLVPVNRVLLQNRIVLLLGERPSLDVWIQLVAPTQPTRFTRPSSQRLRDRGPISRTPEFLNLSSQHFILLRARVKSNQTRHPSVVGPGASPQSPKSDARVSIADPRRRRQKKHPDATLHSEPPLYTITDKPPSPSPRSALVRRPSSILSSARRASPSARPSSSPVVVSRRRRSRVVARTLLETSMRIPSVASRPGPLARAPPRAPARVATSSPRDCCVTISAVHRVRGFARARVATTTRSRSRRRRIERQKNVRLAIVERGAYLGRPRALNHSLVIHHVRHHEPGRRPPSARATGGDVGDDGWVEAGMTWGRRGGGGGRCERS